MARINKEFRVAIELLVANPQEIAAAWRDPLGHPAGCLFRFASNSGGVEYSKAGTVGCLTMIVNPANNVPYVGQTDELTQKIKADKRIPQHYSDIYGREELELLGRWQTRIFRYFKKGGLTNNAVRV